MLVPPVLEIYVVWHPADAGGEPLADWLLDHFHGTTFTGLVGGAVEVYVRSQGWDSVGAPPRPMPFMEALPSGLNPPALSVVIPVLGTRLARAVSEDASWHEYMTALADLNDSREEVGVFPVRLDPASIQGSGLGHVFSGLQRLPDSASHDRGDLCREVSQATAQLMGAPMGETLQVFISHTKRHSVGGDADHVDSIVSLVKDVLAGTRLMEFHDERNIQTSEPWQERLSTEASTSCLLMVRSDLYASREWCQKEVLIAKRAGMPVVGLYAIGSMEDRGSFLTDHVPTVQVPQGASEGVRMAIKKSVNLLVDEALKRALWEHQRETLNRYGFDWLPPHAPEPATLLPWLSEQQERPGSDKLFVLHPDPPLGPGEASVVEELCTLAGMPNRVEVLTPRTFASRGGQA